MEVTSNETIKQAVMAGMGLSFISMHTVMLELATGKLVTLNVSGLPVMGAIATLDWSRAPEACR